MGKTAERWHRVRKNGQGVQFTLEVYIPYPREMRTTPTKAREKIVEEIKPLVNKVREKVRGLHGMTKIYNHV